MCFYSCLRGVPLMEVPLCVSSYGGTSIKGTLLLVSRVSPCLMNDFSIEFLCFFFQAKDLCLRVFARYPEFSGCAELSSFELLSDPKYCGKMKVLEKLLGMCQEEHSKVLLFSRSTQVCI